MTRLTASNIVAVIKQLPTNRVYNYPNTATRTLIEIVDVALPEGPISIKRYNPNKGESPSSTEQETISTEMIWRIATALVPNQPTNFDRVLGASYNTRSALEALLAHTPQFYICYPGRIETIDASPKIRRGHKHIMWRPDKPHKQGVMEVISTDLVISEIPGDQVIYDALTVPQSLLNDEVGIEVARRHAQIQIALVMIGRQLGYRTWIAQNDRGITYKDQKIGEMDGVIDSLHNMRLIAAFSGAEQAARLIDCVWFKNSKLLPAVIEIEHSTGVTSGLTRMKGLCDMLPTHFPTRYVIVASDTDRNKVITEVSRPQFHELDARYFPYSAVEELYALCVRRKITGVTEDFLDCYMERVIN